MFSHFKLLLLFVNHNYKLKAVIATFWATFGKFGLLLFKDLATLIVSDMDERSKSRFSLEKSFITLTTAAV